MTVYHGDALDVLREMADASVDAVVTDPPAGIGFMGRSWDTFSERGKFVGWMTDVMAECLRVLKPGGHALVWAIPRTSHWTATAIEDAGFEVRDVVTHHFGSGFPKSLDVSKAIDKAAGAEREVVGPGRWSGRESATDLGVMNDDSWQGGADRLATAPATDAARQWQGWGTALKPASEHWILARNPLAEPTVASQVLATGTGALNIDGCRVAGAVPSVPQPDFRQVNGRSTHLDAHARNGEMSQASGRWPANLVLSHADCGEECVEGCPVAELDRQSGDVKSSGLYSAVDHSPTGDAWATSFAGRGVPGTMYADSGGASRFFPTFRYEPKADGVERSAGLVNERSTHPTVKPVELMRWLCRLVTPPGGTVLDPFMGSGSTGVGAKLEGFNFIGVDKEVESVETADRRLSWAVYEPTLFDLREFEER